jgi:hypothetical protein
MAETYKTTTEWEQQRAADPPGALNTDGVSPAVGVYDRPERPARSTNTMAGLFLLLLVLAILAYFVFQWLS